MKNRVISLNNLTIGYKERSTTKVVAKGIDAKLKTGELTALLGSNGIGKSTLLRTLTLNQPLLGGEIRFGERSFLEYQGKELAKLVSIVLTDRIELKNTTAAHLVAMGRAPYTGFWGRVSSEDQKIVDDALSMIKIDHLRDRMVDSLSDGERQKVMIAKALAQQTPIIILDEPTAFLDFPSKVDVMQILHRLTREAGKTVLLSTHDLDLALQIADRVWLMDSSSKLHVGVPEDLSLDGTLSNFFERKGIAFDKDSGLFKVENSVARKMRMVGHGHRFAMIRKAMLRNGVLASSFIEQCDSDFDFIIEVKKESLTICYTSGKQVELHKIEDLLKYI